MCHVYNLDEYSGYRNLYWYLTEFAATRLKWLFVKDLRVYGQISRKPLSFLADGYRNFAVPTRADTRPSESSGIDQCPPNTCGEVLQHLATGCRGLTLVSIVKAKKSLELFFSEPPTILRAAAPPIDAPFDPSEWLSDERAWG